MTPDQLSLLKTIVLNPGDDAPRLVYADWLEEHGETERAEFIRIQCRLASDGYYSDGSPCICQICSALRRRERELLESHGKRWATEVFRDALPDHTILALLAVNDDPNLSPHWQWTRGFISHITCAADAWLRIAPLLVWREGERMICEGCYGSEERTFAGHGNWKCSECPHCDGTGTVPRPMPETVQPIERVRITDAEATYAPLWTTDRYPGIVFELPEQVNAPDFGQAR